MKPEEIARAVAKAQPIVESPTAKLARKLAESPTAQVAQHTAESPTAQLAKKIAEPRVGIAAEQAATLADELQAIRRRLTTPDGSAQAIAQFKARNDELRAVAPQSVTPWLRTAKGRRIAAPLPAPIVVPPPIPQKIDTEGLIRRAKEIFDEDAEAKRELDREMVATMGKMHAALVEANQREAAALDSAKAAEDREVAAQARAEKRATFNARVAVGSMAFGALSFVAAVVAIIIALNAH